jgi:2-oxoglutarate dehydrogenase E2 component (dihydrolipoamide succinyltransferase)
MPTDITMPQLGESVTEGTVGRWLKQPGDAVAKYEPLLEVITDKVDTEVPAPVAGTLAEILVPEGETVRVGTVIARLHSSGGREQEAGGRRQEAGGGAQEADTPVPAPAAERNTFLSPVVARLVAEHNLDPARIPGTGQGGRVTKQDVLRFLAEPGRTQHAASQQVAPQQAEMATSAVSPQPSALSRQPSVVSPQPSALPEDAELIPLSPMRRSIAEHMERSIRISPHVTTVMEADLGRVIAHRYANKAAFERQGVRLTFTPYFIQAVVAGLQAVPVLNGSFTEQGIVQHRRMHIGVAVALDEGLLVPVVRDADEKNLLGLARAVNDLSERARTRRLQPDETQGGTFTITNHGTSGSLFATPIINQPQAGILGVGAIVKRPVVISQGGVDAIAIASMCYLSLTFDHRITDGATADAFLAAVKDALEQYG